jgi:hypothetical protein
VPGSAVAFAADQRGDDEDDDEDESGDVRKDDDVTQPRDASSCRKRNTKQGRDCSSSFF